MSTIDERIVAMKFNNSQFQTGVKTTLDSLSALKAGLNLDGAKKGLQELDEAGKKFSLANLANGVEGVSAKFVAMATVAITALANITNRAIDTGIQLVRSLTVDPVKMGLEEYETNLNAIQTILANTQSKGTVLSDVNGALQQLNLYADQTIYNFAEMARNIGTFTAAGVDLDTSVSAIKGIANLAALSGSNSQQASTAMYQLSQALSTGTVKLMDWNSVVNAGMGGQVFQDAIKETARNHGIGVDAIIEKEGSFRDSLQQGWLTSEILTETLSKLTGDLTDQQLEAMGYTAEQIVGIQQMATTASDAATKVKTMSQLIGTLQESAQSGWSQTWQIIFGDFEEAKELFTGVNNVLGGMIGASADARNKMLQDWKDLGGRTVLIEAVQNAFKALMDIFKPVQAAFRSIFPATTGQQLYDITVAIRDFTERLTLSSSATNQLYRTFKGVFAALGIGVEVIKGLLGVFGDLFGEVTKGSGGFLEITARVGDFLVELRNAIKNGDDLTKFFSKLSAVITTPIALLREFATWVRAAFGGKGVATEGLESGLDRIRQRLEPLKALGDAVAEIWSHMWTWFQKVWDFYLPLSTALGDFFSDIATGLSNVIKEGDFSQLLDVINTGLFAGLVILVKKFLSNGINVDAGGGFLSSISGAFERLTGVMKSMQTQLKADALLKIAGAIALLTVSVVALSLIDSAKLTSALTAMTVMFTQLFVSLAIFEKATAGKGFAKMPLVTASLILLSTAVLILTAAVKNLSSLSWEELLKGLIGVSVLLGALAGTAKLLATNSKGLISAGAGMIVVAVAVKILASAVEDFAAMDWDTMARGFAGVGAALTALAIFTRLAEVNKGALAQSAGLILLGVALKVIASAIGDFADMSWEELGRGFAAMAVALGLIAGAIALIPPTVVITAAGLVTVAAALIIVAQALKMMAGMSWEEIGKGLATLAGALLIIAGAMYLMTAALPGAAALIIVAGALAILTPVLLAMAGMSWEEIGKGLAMLAGVFLVIGLAGLALTPVIPSLIGLGVAVALLGVGTLAAGLGLLAFSAGLVALSVAGAAGTLALTAMVGAIIGLIPAALIALAEGVVGFLGVIAGAGPQFVAAMTTMLMSLLKTIDILAPAIIDTLYGLIMKLVDVLSTNVPKFVDKGLQMITGILTGIGKNISGIVEAALTIVAEFINGIAKGIPKLVDAGINLIITFVESLADGIRKNTDRMNAAGQDLAKAIVEGMTKGLTGGVNAVVDAAKGIAKSALNAAKNLLGIKSPSREFFKIGEYSTEGMANGLEKTSNVVEKAAEGVAANTLTAFKKSMSGLGEAVSMDMDMVPTIRPVLDLSAIKKDSGLIDGMLSPSSISAESSYNKAASISVDTRAAQQALLEERSFSASPAVADVTFIQNNNSPKSLGAGEIYRQTRNQLSVVKGALPR